MIQDLWNSIRLYIEDRLSSPLLTGFLFAWSIINYRFFLVVLSSEHFTQKMLMLEWYVFPTFEDKIYKGLVYPLLIALVYVLLYPFLDRLIFRVWRWHQHRLLQIRQRIDEERPLSEKDRVQLLSQLNNIQKEHDDETQRLRTLLDSQRIRIKELEAPPSVSRTEAPVSPPSLRVGVEQSPSPSRQDAEVIMELPLNIEGLTTYLAYKFPGKPIGQDIAQLLLRDIDKNRYRKIGDLDSAYKRALPQVKVYAEERPDRFTKAADYLTKTLGFVDEDFRKSHPFAEDTRQAFERLGSTTRNGSGQEDRKRDQEFTNQDSRMVELALSDTLSEQAESDFKKGFDRAAFLNSATKEEALLRLTQLRSEGVRIRNGAENLHLAADFSAWSKEVQHWMNEVIHALKRVSESDSEWFATLDTVPPARVSIPNVRLSGREEREQFQSIFRQHDYRLARLESLLRKHGVGV